MLRKPRCCATGQALDPPHPEAEGEAQDVLLVPLRVVPSLPSKLRLSSCTGTGVTRTSLYAKRLP